MKACGITDRIIDLDKIVYEDNIYSGVDGAGIYEWFEMKSGFQ